jgi:hypothetical protein
MSIATDDIQFGRGETRCSYHPDVVTGLRCSRCGKPICPKCGIRTPVGMRCPDCAGVRGLPTYKTDRGVLLKSFAAAIAIAAVVGVMWGYFPNWQFYLSLLLGFGVAESMAKIAGGKRGRDLLVSGWAAILMALVISRVVLAQRLGLPWEVISELGPFVERWMYLRIIPDGVFAAIPFLIVFIRFR